MEEKSMNTREWIMVKVFKKKYIFGGMFFEISLPGFKIIWQNKRKDILKNICVPKTLSRRKIIEYLGELNGRYGAVTHETVMNRLRKAGVEVKEIYEIRKPQNIRGIHERIMRDSKCAACEIKHCSFRDGSNTINAARKEWIIYFTIDHEK